MECRKLHDVTLVFGDRVKFDVPIFGEPAPEVVWTFEATGNSADSDGPLTLESTPDRNVIVTSNESHAKLVINRSVLMDHTIVLVRSIVFCANFKRKNMSQK